MRGRNVLQRRTKLPLRKLTRILRAHSTDSSLRWERRRAAEGYNRYKRCRLPSSVCVCVGEGSLRKQSEELECSVSQRSCRNPRSRGKPNRANRELR